MTINNSLHNTGAPNPLFFSLTDSVPTTDDGKDDARGNPAMPRTVAGHETPAVHAMISVTVREREREREREIK